MKTEHKIEMMEINKQLRQGDKRIIAELTGYHEKHVINTLNGKIRAGKSGVIILRVARMIVDNRNRLIDSIKSVITSKTA